MDISGSISSDTSNPENWFSEGFFARHETFCPRYGWLKKGFDAVKKDPDIFDQDNAIEILGVGKNMVRAIRFWCVAFHVIQPSQAPKLRLSGPMETTEFGQALLSNKGWDPFLEDPSSLWLLHWNLFVPPIAASAWSLAINVGDISSFTLKSLTETLLERKNRSLGSNRYSQSSVVASR